MPAAYASTTNAVKSPLPIHIVNTITAALSINEPAVQFDPVQIGTTGDENATQREHFFDASWKRQQRESKRPLFRQFVHAVVSKGEGVLKTVPRTARAWAGYNAYSKSLDADLKSGGKDGEYAHIATGVKDGDYSEYDRIYNARTEEKKRQMPYPIHTTDVPPETFYAIKGEDGFAKCVEVKQVPYYDTLARYKMGLNASGKVVPEALGLPQNDWGRVMSGAQMLTMTEVWDWKECVYILNGPGQDKEGTLARKPLKHGYGDPYLHTLRGPYFQAYGITTSSRELHLMGLSVLFGFLDLFPQLNSLLTIQGRAAYTYGYPTFRRKAGPEMVGQQPAAFGRDKQDILNRQETIETGSILPWDIEPVDLPRSGPDLHEGIQIMRNLIEMALPSIVQGVVSGDESGYLLNQATHLARLVWDPIVDNVSVALAERVGFESWLIEKKIGETVYAWGERQGSGRGGRKARGAWLGIGPDDLKGVHRYDVHLNPATPSSDVIKLRTHDEALKLRVETRRDAITDMGRNPDEVEAGWLEEDVKAALKPKVIDATLQLINAKTQAKVDQANALEGQPQGQGFGGLPDVVQPGQQGQPLEPTPAGEGAAGTAGLPAVGGQPNPPAGHMPLPGQG